MNSYFSLAAMKSRGSLDIQTSVNDVEMLRLLVEASRSIDLHTKRFFYSFTAAKLFNGPRGTILTVPDLIAVDSLKTDEDLDRTFEKTWLSTDFLLDPADSDPTSPGNSDSRPFYEIVIDVDAGRENFFPSGRRSIQVTGRWGYWEHLRTATETANTIADADTKTLTVSANTDVSIGHTIIIDAEQIYIAGQGDGDKEFTVVRGVNGTTAASHVNNSVIQIYDYPQPIADACYAEAARLFKRAQTGFAPASAIDGTGAFPGMDRDVLRMINFYRLWVFR